MKTKFLFFFFFIVPLAGAQTDAKKVLEPEPKVKTGTIANSGVGIGGIGDRGGINVNTTESTPGETATAISGGVSNAGGECSANLNNASKLKTYRVRFNVIGTNQKGSEIFRKNFSGSISPQGKLVKTFKCKEDALLRLDLKSVEPVK